MVWLAADGPTLTQCYRRELLQPQNCIAGPALILQYDSTLLLAEGWAAVVDSFGNLICEKRAPYA
jgi:N-methylhydantoinase A/oxoprolinase/acetone carboxylase beta subunit